MRLSDASAMGKRTYPEEFKWLVLRCSVVAAVVLARSAEALSLQHGSRHSSSSSAAASPQAAHKPLSRREPDRVNSTLASVWAALDANVNGTSGAKEANASAPAKHAPPSRLAAGASRLPAATVLHAQQVNANGTANASLGNSLTPTYLKASDQALQRATDPVFQRQARVYFLFLAVDKVSNLNVWRSFFAEAPVDQYRAFVHCKLPQCTASVAGSPLIAVPTVPSYYCTDLVSPMNQLLSVALSSDLGSTNRNDRFVFVSDSSLPAKPFWHIYATLTAREGSDFCVFPSKEWADVQGSFGIDIAVKHHQWVSLTREHAERASGLWASGLLHDFMQRYQMNVQGWTGMDNNFADNRNFGCLDEFWYMATLYGPLAHDLSGSSQAVYLPSFSSGPLQIHASTGWQGMCDTFVLWSQYVNPWGGSAFDRLLASLDKDSQPHTGNFARPGWWDRISSNGIAAIRASEFLFVRKFVDGPALADPQPLPGGFAEAYTRLVFGR